MEKQAAVSEAVKAILASINGERDELPMYEPGIAEYIMPPPWVDKSTIDLANHTLSYTPQPKSVSSAPQPQANVPQYVYNKGDQKVLVILAEFTDIKHRTSNTKAAYESWVNGNSSSDRSMRTYFWENSYGNYHVIGTVTDWVTLPNTMAYYDQNTARLVGDAATAANSQIDFTQFLLDGDNYVDNLIIIHAGGDQAVGCSPNCIWSHSGYGYRTTVDGAYVQAYCTLADFGGNGDQLGVLLHEFGHLGLNLPDLYDTQYENSGLGDWELMAGGSWGGGGQAPAHLSAWPKLDLGWETFYEPEINEDGYTIYAASDTARHNPVKINTNYTDEYFLVEFRSTTAGSRYDTYLPVSGLVIFHVDSTAMAQRRNGNYVMYPTSHKAIDIEEVGTQDMDQSPWNQGSSNDVWRSSAVGWTPTSTPNSNLYRNNGNYATGIRVFNVSAVLSAGGQHMTFNIDTGRVNFGIVANAIGSAELVATPGTWATYQVRVRSLSALGDGATLTLTGPNAASASLDRTSLTLPPFGADIVNLTVSVPSGAQAGDSLYVDVRATSTTNPAEFAVVPTTTRAAQVFNVYVTGSLDASDVTPETNVSVIVTVWNGGNGADNITMSPIYDPLLIDAEVVNQPEWVNSQSSTAVTLVYRIPRHIPYQTTISVGLDVVYGIDTPLHLFLYGNVTVGKFSAINISVQAAPLTNLTPGDNETINLILQNEGNYASMIDLSAVGFLGLSLSFDTPTRSVPSFFQVAVVATVRADPNVAAFTRGTIYFTASSQDGRAVSTDGAEVMVLQRFQILLSGQTSGTGLPGSTVNVPVVATNFGNGLDAMRMTVTPAFSEWNPVLSDADFALGANATTRSTDIMFSVSIPTGASGNQVQQFTLTLMSQGQDVLSSLTVSVLVLPVYSFTVSSTAAQTGITSTETASYLLSFRNTGNVRDSYSITVAGLTEGWRMEFAEGEGVVTVGPGFTSSLTLILKPPTTISAGDYDFQMIATSEGDLAQRKVLLDNVTILSRHQISIRTTTVDGDVLPGALVTVRIVIQNLGNVEERIVLTSSGPLTRVTFDPLEVRVGPYGEATATAIVLVDSDQAAGYAPLVISAASVSNSNVATENTVGITVKSPPTQASPGVEAWAAVGALAAVGVTALVSRRRRL